MRNIKINYDKRGEGVSPEALKLANRLRECGFELQRRFLLAEKSMLMLKELVDDTQIYEKLNNSYEFHVLAPLKLQLFRILVVDLWGCIFDKDTRTGSVRSILIELRRNSTALDSLKDYYSDCTVLEFKSDPSDDEDFLRELAMNNHKKSQINSVNEQWEEIDKSSGIIDIDEAKRLKWIRHKIIVHYEKTESGLHVLTDSPPEGDGPLRWNELFCISK
ncbi:MAG: hypothetical protein L3J46_06415 [Kangiellaceae bacterium]|nr:hypothetical protein [Kangiellaceae bacterium]